MTDIRVWVDGTLVGADTPAVSAVDHGVTVGDGAFETAKIDHGVPFAVTRHLRRLDRTIAGLGLPAADHDRIREGIDGGARRRADRVRPAAVHRDRGARAARLGPARLRPHPHRHRGAARPPRGARRRGHRALGAQRAGGDGRAEDDVVRRQRHRPGPGQGAGRPRGDLRQHPRRAVRGHRQQRVRRGRRRRAHAAARQRVPGRHHPRAGAGVVRRRRGGGGRGGPAARRADPGRRRSSSPPRSRTCSRCRRSTAGPCRPPGP